MTLTKTAFYSLAVLAVLAFMYLVGASAVRTEASVGVTNEYTATSTAASSVYGAAVGSRVVKVGTGAFGSFIITGANTGIVNFYDATTSDITKRNASLATSTILIASIPASTVAGTYTFDVALSNGLFIDLISGNMATGTVTYR